MQVRDKQRREWVDVAHKDCPQRECYWPRRDPGVFVPGQGYRVRYPRRKEQPWICGRRAIHGCP